MREINIYGDIVPFKWFNDGSEFDLQDLNKALSSASDMSEGEELIINIHTFGGCTVTAFAIFNKLRRFTALNKILLTTRIDGYCASAGVAVFLAGDKRIGNAYAEPFVHNAWTWMMGGDKADAKKVYEDLERTDNQIATLYAERTKISKENALALMDADTTLTPEEAMQFGFYTEMENVFVADTEVFNSLRSQRTNLKNNNKMSKNKGAASAIINAVKKHLGIEKLNLVLFTAAQEELDFYDLNEGDVPKVGDMATFGGDPAGDSNDGIYVMASGDTYKFEGEELKEITPKADDAGDDPTADEALVTENADLKAEITNLKAKNTALNKKLTTAKADLSNANSLLNKVASLDLGDDPDEDDEDEADDAKSKARAAKPKKTNSTEDLRNILQSI